MDQTSTCRICEKELPHTAFYFRYGKPYSECKRCRNDRTGRARGRTKPYKPRTQPGEAKQIPEDGMLMCSQCKTRKHVTGFHKKNDWYHSHCKACRSENNRTKYALKRRAARTRRKVLLRNSYVSDVNLEQVFHHQNGQCWWCGVELTDYHADHVIPLSKGGTHEPGNVRLSCVDCNQSKHMKMAWEFTGRLF